jgi:hypothetical protein
VRLEHLLSGAIPSKGVLKSRIQGPFTIAFIDFKRLKQNPKQELGEMLTTKAKGLKESKVKRQESKEEQNF